MQTSESSGPRDSVNMSLTSLRLFYKLRVATSSCSRPTIWPPPHHHHHHQITDRVNMTSHRVCVWVRCKYVCSCQQVTVVEFHACAHTRTHTVNGFRLNTAAADLLWCRLQLLLFYGRLYEQSVELLKHTHTHTVPSCVRNNRGKTLCFTVEHVVVCLLPSRSEVSQHCQHHHRHHQALCVHTRHWDNQSSHLSVWSINDSSLWHISQSAASSLLETGSGTAGKPTGELFLWTVHGLVIILFLWSYFPWVFLPIDKTVCDFIITLIIILINLVVL